MVLTVMLLNILKLLRPVHWFKNIFCFAGVFFAEKLNQPVAIKLGFYTFLIFCAASSFVYIINDLADRDRDKNHPLKKARPIAAGKIQTPVAIPIVFVLGILAIIPAFYLSLHVLACVLLYMVLNIFYTYKLKHIVLIDVFSIAFGFVLRLLAGIYILGDIPTTWIVLCTYFLTVYLGFTKRKSELLDGNTNGSQQRPVLDYYTKDKLNMLITTSFVMAFISYALFTVLSGKNPGLVITVPIVYYAFLHFHRLTEHGNLGQEPELIPFKDPVMMIVILVWCITYYVIQKSGIILFR